MYSSLAEALEYGSGTERAFICPVHDDRSPSASVNVIKGLWYCYACGARGKLDGNYEVPDHVFAREVNRMLDDQSRLVYPESWLRIYTASGPGEYWLSRYSPEACEHFQLGIDIDGEWATYPLRGDAGELLGVVGRNLSDEGPKYRYPYGVDVSKHLFNYHSCTQDTIVLVEGATDVFACWEAGYDAMATYGVNSTADQHLLIRRYAPKRVILAFDQDRAGNKLAQDWQELLSDIDHVTRPKWRDYKDVSEIPLSKRVDSLEGKLDRITRIRIVSEHGTKSRDRDSDPRRTRGAAGIRIRQDVARSSTGEADLSTRRKPQEVIHVPVRRS